MEKTIDFDMGIFFRKAISQDAEQLKEIASRVIRHNYVPFLGVEATNSFIDSGMSDKEIDDGLGCCTVMLAGDTIIGFAITDNDLLHLIMVDVSFQGKTFGSKLLKHMEAELLSHCKTIRLQAFKENADTARFYLNNGWHIIGEEKIKELDKTMLSFTKTRGG